MPPKATKMPRKTQSTDSLDDLESQIDKAIEPTQSEERPCCIYAIPKTLIDTNGVDVYRPGVVSIGPCHRSEPQVKVIKKHKVEFLKLFLSRKKNLGFNELMESIRPLAKKARECYSKEINLESFNDDDDDRFLKMMVLDGCFLIELFLKAAEKKARTLWPSTYRRQFHMSTGTFLWLENQIPFFVLEELFTTIKNKPDASETSKMPSLSFLALRFFNKVMQRPDGVIEKFRQGRSGQHPISKNHCICWTWFAQLLFPRTIQSHQRIMRLAVLFTASQSSAVWGLSSNRERRRASWT
jgi:hypothetical protein